MDWISLTINQWSNILIDDWIVLPLYYEPAAGETPDIIQKDLYITREHSYGVYTNIGVLGTNNKWYDLSSDDFDNFTYNDWMTFYAQSGLCFFNIYNKDLHVKINKLGDYER